MSTDTLEAPAKAKPKVKPATIDLMTQFCKSADQTMHLHCKGSGRNGVTTEHMWYCSCDCHVEHPTCRDCGARDVEVTLEGTCVDVDGCEVTQSVRRSTNPVHQQVRDILNEAALRESEEKARKAAERAAQREREAAKAKAEGRPEPVRATRTPKAPPTPQQCHCGCGAVTKGGRFQAGHDARLKGMLIRAARQTAPESGKPATKTQAIRAMAELIARGWPRKGVNAKITEQAEALVDQYGIDKVIETAVDSRYVGSDKQGGR